MDDSYLSHHGILGQKWGIRRYQNPDGTLTNAGKKRYAKKLAQYTDEDELVNTFVKELATNKAVDRETIRAKRKAWLDADAEDNKFYESSEHKEARKKAYDETYKWFEKNDREYLKEIIKNNDGSKNGLDAFHDFRKMYEGYEDEIVSQAHRAYNKKNGIASPAKVDKLLHEYVEECKKAEEAIIGKYGKMKVKNIQKDFYGRPETWTLWHYFNSAEWQYFG